MVVEATLPLAVCTLKPRSPSGLAGTVALIASDETTWNVTGAPAANTPTTSPRLAP